MKVFSFGRKVNSAETFSLARFGQLYITDCTQGAILALFRFIWYFACLFFFLMLFIEEICFVCFYLEGRIMITFYQFEHKSL